jgi:hypothetical protein
MGRVSLVLCAVTVWSSVTTAQPAGDLFSEGRALLDQNRPAEACEKFDRALALDPNKPGLLLNLGQCNAKQNKTATALVWFRRALALATERKLPEVASVATAQIKSLGPTVPTIQIVVTGADHPTVTIDQVRVAETTFPRTEVDAGTHSLEARTPDGRVSTLTIVVQDVPDARQRVLVELKPTPPAVTSELHETWIVVDRGAGRRHAGLVIGGVGLGVTLASAGVGVLARVKFDGTDDIDSRKKWKNVALYGGTSLFVGGAAALAIGVGLYLGAPREERVRQTAVVPIATPDGAGLVVEGAF